MDSTRKISMVLHVAAELLFLVLLFANFKGGNTNGIMFSGFLLVWAAIQSLSMDLFAGESLWK